MEFFHKKTSFRFMATRKVWYTLSAILMIVSFVSFFAKGLNFAIDFTGGIALEASFSKEVSTETVRQAVDGVEAVIHLAAILPPASERDRAKTFAVNVDGTTHLVRGMYRPLTVVPGSAAQRAEPAPRADVTVTMRAYGYELSAPLRAGRRVLRLDNAGPQDHHVLVQRLAPGRTKADVERWLAGGRRGERPVSPIFFGTSRQAPGETSYVTIDLEPGAYLFICRVDDAGDGRPHVEHGMRTEVRVR